MAAKALLIMKVDERFLEMANQQHLATKLK
jgi:hypothetical protein